MLDPTWLRRALATAVALTLTAGLAPGLPAHAVPHPVAATTLSTSPLAFPEVKGSSGHDGEVLATTVGTVKGVRSVVLGGNFDYLVTPDGRRHPAANLAAVSVANPNRVVYAGRVDSFVRALAYSNGALYFGGDFTAVSGVRRNHIAKLDAAGRLSAWNPGAPTQVTAVALTASAALFGDSGKVYAADRSSGRIVWGKAVSGGGVRTLLVHGSSVYVGGMFESYDGHARHGLVRAGAATGVMASGFDAHLRPDRRSTYDGDCVLSLAWDAGHHRLVVGSGGNTRNSLWSLNPASGSWGGSGWGRERIPSEGDVQAVAVAGDRVVTGFHRNHVNKVAPVSNRFLNVYSASSGAFVRGDVGLWGTQSNEAHSNNGVSALAYSDGRLLVGGSFRGYGDPFRNTGTARDNQGAPGKYRQGVLVLAVNRS